MKTRFPLPKLKNDLLLRVINHLPVERVPVWMMRQADEPTPYTGKFGKQTAALWKFSFGMCRVLLKFHCCLSVSE